MVLATSGWTDRHTKVALLLGVALLASIAGLLEEGPIPFWVAIAVVIAGIGSLSFDAFAGTVVGLAVAAGLIGVRRLTGWWGPEIFWPALVESLAVIAAGISAGVVGGALRATTAVTGAPDGGGELSGPVFGSLGLLDHATAVMRLEEEVERASEHGRPLTLLLLDVEVTDDGLGPQARTGAFRSVARLLESRLADTDVPFFIGEDRLGAVLPESTAADAWTRLGALLDGITDARFASRAEGRQRSLADAVDLRVGMAHMGPDSDHADGLLDAASAALRRAASKDRSVERGGAGT